MVGASRLMRPSRGLQSDHLPSSSSSPSSPCGRPPGGIEWPATAPSRKSSNWKRMAVPLDTAISSSTTNSPHNPLKLKEGVESANLPSSLTTEATKALVRLLGLLSRLKLPSWSCSDLRLQTEMLIEQGVIGCQSFTLIAVAGSLIGSVLCFVEGCFFVVESYIEYFRTMSQNIDQTGIIQLLIEAIDMFLVGSALLTFGMGMYVMFNASNEVKQGNGWSTGGSNKKNVPLSITEAKSKFGHALMMILQAGVLDKFKNVPLSSGLDLACFAGAVFISSASVFLLSKLAMKKSSKTTC
ncbi:hypothetical protein J5N97_010035 [Dioscorea zingiberensis]|uniref:Uncharacterized protein n=1 Tax=Dioscorea zingiberensis TaxID=325984 RepID=A0A9D5HM42_9LILI|nr:hypothetical protein J5N97_010035 [Dioscorea zingiberensis]